jgi:hypothetical protein
MSWERLFVNSSFLLKHSLISKLIRLTGRAEEGLRPDLVVVWSRFPGNFSMWFQHSLF